MKSKKIFLSLFVLFIGCVLFSASAVFAAEASSVGVAYQTYVQRIGNQNEVSNGAIAGTTGRGLRVEGISLRLKNVPDGSITYRAHVQNIGWQNWQKDGAYAGTKGRSLRIEALQIKLMGNAARKYDVYYCVHAQGIGWMNWAKNGASAGTEGLSLRVEAIRVMLVKKEEASPTFSRSARSAFISKQSLNKNIILRYQTHVQRIGWQGWKNNGQISGTTARGLRVEAVRIALQDSLWHDSYLSYHAHIQNIGDAQAWQDSRHASGMVGTTGQGKRVEAIQIKPNGSMAAVMDVYYRVHVQHYGWLGWAKNGEWAGTANGGLRVEAIQIQLRTRHEGAPGTINRHYLYIKKPSDIIRDRLTASKTARKTDKIVLVYPRSSNRYHAGLWQKQGGRFTEILSTNDGRVGARGLSWNRHKGDMTTPIGAYRLTEAFGIGNNPGTKLKYYKLNNRSYWGDDTKAWGQYRNRYHEGRLSSGGEHLLDYPVQYKYAINIGFNYDPVITGKGSAIFLHCNGKNNTAGCVSVPENTMRTIITKVDANSYIIIVPSVNHISDF